METDDANREGRGERLELDDFFPYRLSVVQQDVSRAIARTYEQRYGLARNEWRVMAALGCDQPLSANGVAARTNMDKVQVSRAIARLRRRGLVARQPDASDRRRSCLRLTADGLRIYREIVPLARACEAELLSVMNAADLRRLDALLDRVGRRARALNVVTGRRSA